MVGVRILVGPSTPAAAAFAVLVGWVAMPPPARAADVAGDPLLGASATSLALGGAARGSARNLDNVLYMPAVTGLDSTYDVAAGGLLESGDGPRRVQVSAVDSRTSKVTLGLAWRWAFHPDAPLDPAELPGWQDPDAPSDNTSSAHLLALGLALPDANRRVSLGATVGRWWRSERLAGDAAGWRAGISLAGRPAETVTLALGGSVPFLSENPQGLEDQAWLDGGFRWQPASWGALVADALLPLPGGGGPDLSAGLEGSWAPATVRAGWFRPGDGSFQALSAGLALGTETASAGYAIRLPVAGDASTLHAATVTLVF